MAKKPTLETHSDPCCGECYFCHQISKTTGCFAYPPKYIYGEDESPTFLNYVETNVTRPSCSLFKRKGEH